MPNPWFGLDMFSFQQSIMAVKGMKCGHHTRMRMEEFIFKGASNHTFLVMVFSWGTEFRYFCGELKIMKNSEFDFEHYITLIIKTGRK